MISKNTILFVISIVCLNLGIYFLLTNNLFLSIVSVIVSSFFSSTRKYCKLQIEIKQLKDRCKSLEVNQKSKPLTNTEGVE